MNDFSNDVSINKYKLDDELLRQPQSYYDWAKAEVIAGDKVNSLREDLEVMKSKVEIRIRKNPTLFDLPDNPKEGLIKAAVSVQKKIRRANQKLIAAQKTHRLLQKAEKAFEHRKKSLEGLVSLNMQMHFANPKNTQRRDLEAENQKNELLQKARSKRRIKRR